MGTAPARRFSATAGLPGWLAGTLRRLLRAAPHLCPPLSCPLPTPVPCLPVSQVFLRAGKMAELDKRKMEVQHAAATAIQTAVRGYLARKHFARARAAAITIQAAARGMAARSEARHLRRTRAATVIQAAARRWAARRAFTTAVRAAVAVQAAWRGWKARLYTRDIRQHRAALAIQTHWRRHRAQAEFQRYRKGVVTAQVRRRACGGGSFVLCRRVNTACSSRSPVLWASAPVVPAQLGAASLSPRVPRCPQFLFGLATPALALPLQSLWRGKLARRELRRRRQEAREAGKLLQDKQALESKLREMQNVLETVQGQRNELKQQYRVGGDAERMCTLRKWPQQHCLPPPLARARASLPQLP